jgi:hypothetical protein
MIREQRKAGALEQRQIVPISAAARRLFCWSCGDFYLQGVPISPEVSGAHVFVVLRTDTRPVLT